MHPSTPAPRRAGLHPEAHPSVSPRTGKKIRVKCNEDDTIGDLKKLVAAQTGASFCDG